MDDPRSIVEAAMRAGLISGPQMPVKAKETALPLNIRLPSEAGVARYTPLPAEKGRGKSPHRRKAGNKARYVIFPKYRPDLLEGV